MLRLVLALGIALLTVSPAAHAEAVADDSRPAWSITAKGGVSAFMTSNSPALGHVLQPAMRLEGAYRLSDRLEVGAEVGVVISGDANYAFESASLVLRTPLYEGEVFAMRMGWGFGLGSGPRILFDDLVARAPVVPTLQVSLGLRWQIVCDAVDIGLEVINEQLTVLSAVGTVTFKL